MKFQDALYTLKQSFIMAFFNLHDCVLILVISCLIVLNLRLSSKGPKNKTNIFLYLLAYRYIFEFCSESSL